jgi:hypothetical protein
MKEKSSWQGLDTDSDTCLDNPPRPTSLIELLLYVSYAPCIPNGSTDDYT